MVQLNQKRRPLGVLRCKENLLHSLTSGAAEEYVGWDNKSRKFSYQRRVALVDGKHVTVIQFSKPTVANFITAYVADVIAVQKMRKHPAWSTSSIAISAKKNR